MAFYVYSTVLLQDSQTFYGGESFVMREAA